MLICRVYSYVVSIHAIYLPKKKIVYCYCSIFIISYCINWLVNYCLVSPLYYLHNCDLCAHAPFANRWSQSHMFICTGYITNWQNAMFHWIYFFWVMWYLIMSLVPFVKTPRTTDFLEPDVWANQGWNSAQTTCQKA